MKIHDDSAAIASALHTYRKICRALVAQYGSIKCAGCGDEIPPGADVWRYAGGTYCSPQCAATAAGAEPYEYGDAGYEDLFPCKPESDLHGLAARENLR